MNLERLLSAAIGGLITFATMYITVVGKYVTRQEVSQMIVIESPYVRDQRWITEKLSGLDSKMDDIDKKLDRLLVKDAPQ